MAAYASFPVKLRFSGLRIKAYGLMSSVHARYIASAAAVAALMIENREYYSTPFDIIVVDNCLRRNSDQIADRSDAAALHVFTQARDQIIDDPVPVLHHRSRDLNTPRSEQNEF